MAPRGWRAPHTSGAAEMNALTALDSTDAYTAPVAIVAGRRETSKHMLQRAVALPLLARRQTYDVAPRYASVKRGSPDSVMEPSTGSRSWRTSICR